MRSLCALICVFASLSLVVPPLHAADAPLRIATFQADITPPLGTPLCDGLGIDPAKEIVDPLTSRGIILLTGGEPIVLCAMDWVGVGNTGYESFRGAIAKAVGTSKSRVSVHCLHQHDAPGFDPSANDLLVKHGLGGKLFNPEFGQIAVKRTADAAAAAIPNAKQVTQLGIGKGKVEKVASNRRLLGPDGKVKHVRFSSCTDPAIIAEPEGVIDPYVQLLSFWDGEKPVAVLSYYATHPQSYYGKGGVSADFVGMARGLREAALPGVAVIHFNGASGNVAAGKYNDGAKMTRPILAERLAEGAKIAWETTKKVPIQAKDIEWRVVSVALPPSKRLEVASLEARMANENERPIERLRAGRDLAWLNRCLAGEKIELSCLKIGPAYVLHMPGELFIEYQLAAQQMRPDSPVLMAAYADYGPGYIGTTVAYPQGGYETGIVSRVAPEVEAVLMPAMKELLK